VSKDPVDLGRKSRARKAGKDPVESDDDEQGVTSRRARTSARQGRKKKPRKDESSSCSSSSRKRAPSSKKSVSKAQKGPKVIPESNSPSSSTSDSDESAADTATVKRVKHMLKPPKFDGESSFETFWAQFENCAEHNKWARAQKLVLLKNSLIKDAANVLWDYGKEVTGSLSGLTETLKNRFGGASFQEKNRIELKNRRRIKDESLKTLHIDIRRLSTLAYPDTDHKTREVLSCDHFIDALADKDLVLKIRERRPRDLDTALQIALELEVWAQDSERFAQDTERAPQLDAKKVREFTDPGTVQQAGKQGKQSADIYKELSEQRKLVEKMFNKFQKSLAELKVSTHADTPRPTPNAGGAKPWQKQGRAPFYCWG